MLVPAARLTDTESIPEGMRPFASALKGTQEILLSIGSQDSRLALKFQVTCDSAASASTLLVDLESALNSVRTELAKQRGKSQPGDLGEMLSQGSFRREDRRVYGDWPMERSTLEAFFASP